MAYFLNILLGIIFIFFPKKFIVIVDKLVGSNPEEQDFKSVIAIRMIGFYLVGITIPNLLRAL